MLVDTIEKSLEALICTYEGKIPCRLPQEKELAHQLGVSINTLRTALEPFKKKGLIVSSRGRGNTVVAVPEMEKKKLVHVVLDGALHPFAQVAQLAVSCFLRENGYTPITTTISEFYNTQALDGVLLQKSLGVMLVGAFSREDVARVSQIANQNVVLIGECINSSRSMTMVDHIAYDHTEQAYEATAFFLRQGHKKIALALPCLYEDLVQKRGFTWDIEIFSGYCSALREAGIEPREEWLLCLPGITVFQGDQNRLAQLRGRLASLQNAWNHSDVAPSAMIHAESSESFHRDMLQMFLPGKFQPEQIMGLLLEESLPLTYSGYGSAMATCRSLRDQVYEALECLISREAQKTDRPFKRIILQRSSLWLREEGCWKKASAARHTSVPEQLCAQA